MDKFNSVAQSIQSNVGVASSSQAPSMSMVNVKLREEKRVDEMILEKVDFVIASGLHQNFSAMSVAMWLQVLRIRLMWQQLVTFRWNFLLNLKSD